MALLTRFCPPYQGLESSGEDDGDYFQTTSAPLDLHSRDRPPLFLRVNDNLWVLQNVLPPSEGSGQYSTSTVIQPCNRDFIFP